MVRVEIVRLTPELVDTFFDLISDGRDLGNLPKILTVRQGKCSFCLLNLSRLSNLW